MRTEVIIVEAGRHELTAVQNSSRDLQCTGRNVCANRIGFKSKNEMPELFRLCAAPSVGLGWRPAMSSGDGIQIMNPMSARTRDGDVEAGQSEA
jgi:hypothetical protein